MIHVFVIYFMNHVSENNCQIFFIHSIKTNHEEWFWWNFFIKISMFFLLLYMIFMFFCSYFSHLIKSLNCTNFMFYFILSIKLIKYESFLFLTIINCDNNTCLLIKSFFKNHNKLIWNIKWIFILNDNSNSYI